MLSKTFQNFGFFFHVNQTVTMASNPYLSNKGSNNERKLKNKIDVGGKVAIRFHPLTSVYLLDLEDL